MTRFLLSSLRARLVLLILLAIIPALGLLLHTDLEQRGLATLDVRENGLTFVRLLSADQERIVEGARQLLVALAQLRDVRSGDAAMCTTRLVELLKLLPDYLGFGVAEPDGDVFCSTASVTEQINAADRAWFQRAIQTRGFAVGDYQAGAISGQAILVFAYPALDLDGTVQFVVFSVVTLDALTQLAAEGQLPPEATLIAIDRNGTILAHDPDPETWVGKSLAESPLVQTILTQGQGVAEVAGVDGVTRLYAFTPVRGRVETGVYIGVGIPRQVAFAEVDQILIGNLAGLGLVAAFALTAAWFFGNVLILRRLNALVAVTKRLRRGDLGARAEVASDAAELDQLASAFNDMAVALEQREADRKRAEEALEAQRAFLGQVVDINPNFIFAKDREGRFTLVNQAVADAYGTTVENLIGKTDADVNPRVEEVEHFRRDDLEVMNSLQEKFIPEEVTTDATGKVRWLQTVKRPIVDSDGIARQVLGVATDITSRKAAEQRIVQLNHDLNRRIAELQTLLDVLPVGIGVAHDPRCDRITVNPAGARMLNIPLDANASKSAPGGEQLPFTVLRNGNVVPAEELPMQVAAARGTAVQDVELDVIHEAGTVVNLLEYASPLFDESGKVRGCLGVFVDITARKKAEQLLRLQHAVTRALAESDSLAEVYHRVLQSICEGVGWAFSAVWSVDHDAKVLRNESIWCIPSLQATEFETATRETARSPGIGLPGRVWVSGHSVWIPDVSADTDFHFHRASTALKAGLRAAFAFPFRIGSEVVGVLECFSQEIQQPDEDLLELLDAIGSQIGNFLERRRAEEAVKVRARQQAIVAELGQRGLAGIDQSELMDEAVAHIALTLTLPYVMLLELLPDGDALLLRAGIGWKEGAVGRATVSAGLESLAGYTLHASRPVIVEDLRTEARFDCPALLRDHGVISGMSVIIPGRGQPLGVLGVHAAKRRTFTQDDAYFLQSVANVLAAAIERGQAEKALRLSRDQLAIILEGVADGITAQGPTARLVYANDAAAQIIGYPSPQALLETPLQEVMQKFEIFDESGKPYPIDQLPGRLALQGIESPPVTLRYRVATTGEDRWSITKAKPVFNERGGVELAVNIFQDVTGLKRVEQSQRLLAEAGRLLATSLDYETRLANVAQLAVPYLADWCAVDVLEEDRSIRPLVIAHVDPAKAELAQELRRRYPSDPDAPTGVPNVLRTGQPELYPEIPDSLLEATAQDAEHLKALREFGLASVMIVPLVARGRTLGAMTFVWAESGRRYGPADLALAEELAHDAALAVDNARLYQEAQRLNAELEQRVRKRTAQLQANNTRLKNQIAERKRAEAELAEVRRRLMESREAERLHLAQELHDGPVQDLYGISYQLAGLGDSLHDETGMAHLAAGQATLQQVIQTLRVICGELRPPTLTPFGLERAIRSHAERFQTLHPELDVRLDLMPDEQALPERVRLGLFRIYQQMLSNVVRHAEARQVTIRFQLDGKQAVLEIQDDGRGFTVPTRWIELARRGHLGLIGAVERAEAVEGQLKITSAPGKGTLIRVSVPYRNGHGSASN